jgi:para-nitrobenzyl esterase
MNAVAKTTTGKVEGFEKDGQEVFLGIPFAASTAGNRRWFPLEPVKPWVGVKETKSFGPIAPQIILLNPDNPLQAGFKVDTSLGMQPEASEDCLYLNIWTPGLDNNRRPVMFWIHGGAFTGGTASSPMYNGGVLTHCGDVVVVTINYRVNAFGFLRLKDVTDGRIPSTGNEGMLDQIAALKWVRDNIAAFGGDPGNVTIFGESAGGGSVGGLLGMPAAKGLFHKAISQSGSANFLNTRDEANRYAEHFLNVLRLKGSDVNALRALTMEQVLKAYTDTLPIPKGIRGPVPVVDGETFPAQPIKSIRLGSADGIPLVAGTTSDEWRLWQVMDPPIKDLVEGRMLARFRRMMPNWDITDTVAAYRKVLAARGIAPTPSEIYLAIMTARMFWIPTLQMLEAQGRRGNPAYCYMMTWKSPWQGGKFGACHAIDLGFLWGGYQTDFFGTGPAVDALSGNMQDAWLAFARTGNPSCKGLGPWPRYGQHRETMILGKKCEVQEALFEDERRIWDLAPDNVYSWG